MTQAFSTPKTKRNAILGMTLNSLHLFVRGPNIGPIFIGRVQYTVLLEMSDQTIKGNASHVFDPSDVAKPFAQAAG